MKFRIKIFNIVTRIIAGEKRYVARFSSTNIRVTMIEFEFENFMKTGPHKKSLLYNNFKTSVNFEFATNAKMVLINDDQ